MKQIIPKTDIKKILDEKESKINALSQIQAQSQNIGIGLTPESIAKAVRDSQQSTLTEQSIDSFLKRPFENAIEILERFSYTDDSLEEDLYDYDVIYKFFILPYITDEKKLQIFQDFRDGVLRRRLSLNGLGVHLFRDVAAGRSPEDVGLFKGLFRGIMDRVFTKKDEKLR